MISNNETGLVAAGWREHARLFEMLTNIRLLVMRDPSQVARFDPEIEALEDRIAMLDFEIKAYATGSSAATPQPGPKQGRAVVLDYALKSMKERAEMGKANYGTYLETHNGRDALMDAYQEALDLVMYLAQALLERSDF